MTPTIILTKRVIREHKISIDGLKILPKDWGYAPHKVFTMLMLRLKDKL